MIRIHTTRPIDATVRVIGPMHTWTDDDIVAFFDARPDVTLGQLARWTMRDVAELKALLMGKNHA